MYINPIACILGYVAAGLVKTSSTTGLNYESGSSTSFTLSITVTDTKDSDTQNLSLTMSDVKEAVLFTKKNYVLSIDEGLVSNLSLNCKTANFCHSIFS